MIVRKKIELIVDVEGSGVDYIYQSIIEGMEFNDEEGIIEYEVKDYEEPIKLSKEQLDKRFHAASLILAQLSTSQTMIDYTALARKALKLATCLIREE
jgi:hypothetical protein